MATARYTKRLQKELLDLEKNPPIGITVLEATNFEKWIIAIDGTEGSLYQGDKYKLQFRFNQGYPLESPGPVPVHPHIYSNGHICLSILYDHWSPALTVSSICLSILSMLSSCTEKSKPVDDSIYTSRAGGRSPKDTRWLFHDDTV
ncbi:ubiquitin-conjugating enzyme E2W [Cavenderia fasciculata]|uniref:Ubiquitin-conjugating enzyme E2W n=1 Tax=Cavenderia fasciculata TaxID=261658 RepID=F4Q3Z1_CACFS|nr:ubiquitin-conjugating enzyme E2W [Cavenderia fasciculata]EGG16905.1 ubiquitin-conjugating enzyme E2W [Cavenderia fasciculata]|eukprot:XP_004355379.1 ubiquitin-conjugating enzyme E2W [Cavenderia fasciculata]